ncbi:GNAT family N-acetyltransferase [Aerosakkonema sp. BLCC-F183]|uniref:GNAT family N-acetyltransferase n=1 Tax=Aerosakkonema sp. BLCC-F183 TaxID=3342834 RepID=UPI0035BB6DA8
MLILPDYQLYVGSSLDRAVLVKFMQQTYQELFPGGNISHLADTVDRYFSKDTPLWLVEFLDKGEDNPDQLPSHQNFSLSSPRSGGIEGGKEKRGYSHRVACLWMGNAIDQVSGDRHAHIFLLYVLPKHRRQGIATALMRLGEEWAKARGDRQIGLQVFLVNQPAVNLYSKLGYQTHSLSMVKPIL